MKASLFAAILSLSIASLPLQASTHPDNSSTVKPVSKIDLNQATVEILSKSIKGIGKKRAQAIVKYREEHGNFKSLEELSQVKGLGKQFVKSHQEQLQEAFTVK
ncbi:MULTISPECIES: helix-hairpin-helix domain-containing protein [unclassified Legionella]|uniref:ComEA family DNA-binding protein n=1 Tax=unclassified Legionella TaxID=2622702 RepID=UPI001055DF7A|nr:MULTISPECIES: helix-hairpin-helix domain-containing protein [unclassified Legionella]MDI9819675.1 helix-hairpin-helix domain-containing protein [Legionella sp. PL877]